MTEPPGRRTLPAKLALAFEILAMYARARWALRGHDLPRAVRRLREEQLQPGEPLSVGECLRVSSAVSRLLDPLPLDARCLVRSVVLSALLARRSTPTSLVIAVRPGEEFAAHAWVERDGAPLLPTGEPEFQRLAAL
jgi:hypothetical protein